MKLVTASQMQNIDRRTIRERGIPGIVLMENAGTGAAELLMRFFSEVRKGWVAVIAGRGNNGGDGFVIARCLMNEGIPTNVYLLSSKDEVQGDARSNLERWLTMGGKIIEITTTGSVNKAKKELATAHLFVDAIFGTGLQREVTGVAKNIISFINSLPMPVVAVDIPSGLDAAGGSVLGAAIRADLTVTFGLAKIGHVLEPGKQYVGRLAVVDIGIPRTVIEESDITTHLIDLHELNVSLLDPRPPDAHKGDYGHLCVLAGSPGKTGAAAMICSGALRSGTGLVTLGIPASLNPILEAKLTEAMTEPLPDAETGYLSSTASKDIRQLMKGKTACALGPGISTRPEVKDLVVELIPRVTIPLVIDADGITALAERPDVLTECKRPVIITPHPGEMARLIGSTPKKVQQDRIGVATTFAQTYNCFVVLKGNKTIITTPDEKVYINPTGNPGMASGGMGDVLTGIIGGLLAQGLSPLDAALWGVYLHGLSGDIAARYLGEIPLIARDVVTYLPHAFKEVQTHINRQDIEDHLSFPPRN